MSQTPSTSFVRHPLPIKIVNRFGRFFANRGRTVSLNPDRLIEKAMSASDLTDFGPYDFRPALNKLVASLERDANLTTVGRFIMGQFLEGILYNRLTLEAAYKRQPDILEHPIKKPLFVIGLPRTGTTLLHRLLSQDPLSRFMYSYETYHMHTPPGPDTLLSDPRIKTVGRQMKFVNYLAPEFQLKHPTGALLPEECIALMRHTFASPLIFSVTAHLKSYTKWLDEADLSPTYRDFKKQLQFLQFNFPETRWVLKSPGHLLRPEALLEVFPDACIIQTHRHPEKVVPSWCSLVATSRSMNTDRIEAIPIGEEWSQRWAKMANHTLAVRKTAAPGQFFDINYHELIKAPFKTVEAIYNHFGLKMSNEMEDRLRNWHRNNPKNKHGRHHYSLEQFGLTAEKVSGQFAPYLAQHPLPIV